MAEISTSVLSVKKEIATRTFYNLEVARTNYFHIDVMDGEFVKNNTADLMKDYATTIKHISLLPLDVHLMVKDVEVFIEEYIPLQPDIITFHYESNMNEKIIMKRINTIKENGIKVGISIKPQTNIDEIFKFLPYIHLALIMSVEPGEGGQEFIPNTVNKIKELKEYISVNNLDAEIEVDGGINIDNATSVKDAGATIIVSGTAILNSDNYNETIKIMKQ